MSSLRSRMNRLTGTTPVNDESLSEAAKREELGDSELEAETSNTNDLIETLDPRWQSLDVKLYQHEQGSFLLRRIRYPLSKRHGYYALEQLQAAVSHLTAFHPAQQFSSTELLFLDLETTGLGSGAGNIPFITAIGYMERDGYVLEQAFIRHPAEEYAMLAYLLEKVSSFKVLVTYNGKTFDWPLIENRIIMNGLGKKHSWKPLHIDLLHPSRSVWRNTLASCKLSHVEEERLGIDRIDDVPGSLAPQLYFQYLAEDNPLIVQGVFQHNELDILSLTALTIRFGELLGGRLIKTLAPTLDLEELVRTGLWLEKMNASLLAEQYYELAYQHNGNNPSALNMLAARDKKAGNWDRAVVLWQKVALQQQNKGSSRMDACIELAKYFEHKKKDYFVALDLATQALDQLANDSFAAMNRSKYRLELDKQRQRVARLQRKVQRV
ncbi:ribonuclease H-like domain-containing protein [Paenibacillus sp. GXUN7292]|uniref:ribonuclease H-like domain-containing protein n=1 Tax=Paenibacillus sp. GXUN7292 TaxID=3422499 RepID=UPI003D7E373A